MLNLYNHATLIIYRSVPGYYCCWYFEIKRAKLSNWYSEFTVDCTYPGILGLMSVLDCLPSAYSYFHIHTTSNTSTAISNAVCWYIFIIQSLLATLWLTMYTWCLYAVSSPCNLSYNSPRCYICLRILLIPRHWRYPVSTFPDRQRITS